MERQWLNPDGVAPPVANYSHVVTVDTGDGVLAFISGQVAMDADGSIVAPGDLAGQTDFCYRQLDGIVRSLGGTLADLVKQTTFVTDMSQMAAIVASFVYNAATRDEMLPRKPLPKPQPAQNGNGGTPANGAPPPAN